MYVIDDAFAKVSNGNVSFHFSHGNRTVSFEEAERLADASFLEQAVAEIKRIQQRRASGRVSLTRSEEPASYLRGYQGGLVHIIEDKTGDAHLVSLVRSADAPRSPLQLDIQSGRTDLGKAPEKSITWFRLLTQSGFEVQYSCREVLFGAEQFNQPVGRDSFCYLDRGQLSFSWGGDPVILTQEVSFSPASIHVSNQPNYIVCNFQAGWTALPHLSSIELFQYLVMNGMHDYVDVKDAQMHDGKPLDRQIYVINIATGDTKVYQSGSLQQQKNLGTLLAENKAALEAQGLVGSPVSLKFKAAVEQLPLRYAKRAETLRAIIAQY
jgi:hypothetical protein